MTTSLIGLGDLDVWKKRQLHTGRLLRMKHYILRHRASTLSILATVILMLVGMIERADLPDSPNRPRRDRDRGSSVDPRNSAGRLTAIPKLPEGVRDGDWQGIVAAHEQAKYEIRSDGRAWKAWNPGQQWMTIFDRRGFLTRSTTRTGRDNWSWGLELQGYGIGIEQTELKSLVPEVRTSGGRLSYDRIDRQGRKIEEWYENDQRGFEHGFTIFERPAARAVGGELTVRLRIRGDLQANRSSDGRLISFEQENGEQMLSYSWLKAWDATGRELPSHFVDLGPREFGIAVEENEAVYPITIDPLAQHTFLKASVHSPTGEEFGTSVAISGDTAVVGAPSDDSGSRGINQPPDFVYPYDNSGAAFVFVRKDGIWTQQAHLKSSNSWTGDRFGISVAISGNTIVVGASGESQTTDGVDGEQCLLGSVPCSRTDIYPIYTAPGVGAAYVFVRTGTTWVQQNYLKASNSEGDDYFGCSVAIHGDTIVVGANEEDSGASLNGNQSDNSVAGAGAAYVFFRNGTSWIQQAYLKSALPAANDQFGYAVAIHNNTAIIGAVFQGDGAAVSGAAGVFVRSGSTWSQQALLKAPTPVSGDYFGAAVAVWGDRVVVGAQAEDTNGTDSGAAYVFKRTGTSWNREATLKPSDTDADDNFGYAVAIQGEAIIVAASNENTVAEGAAYLFYLQSTNWVEEKVLRGRKTEPLDRFGSSIGFSEDIAIIGARYEESNATGINGDEENNLLSQSGAAYTFDIEPMQMVTRIVADTGQVSPGTVATIYITITNPSSISRSTNIDFTVPDGLILIPGSCNGGGGVCTMTQSTAISVDESNRNKLRGKAGLDASSSGPWQIFWTGSIAANGSIVISFQVQVGGQAASGTQFCFPVINSGVTQSICFSVTAPPPGPGIIAPTAAAASQLKAGSVLIYNLYTSGLNTNFQDTRLTITNISPVNGVNVHLFFIDGSNCTVADQFVRLTQNQTVSMLASDVDPGVTGYVIAVATDERGCPINQNELIGGALVRFEQGHRAYLPALGISALTGQLPSCTDSSVTATLNFDGVRYNTLPRTLALDSLPSRANLNETMLIVNRLGGDLSTGTSRLESIAGLLFDDQESAQSFVLTGGTCQLIGILGNNFPRTSPRYDTVIPTGRTGWMKMSQINDGAISGAMINHSTIGFSQGHNLHVLTTTSTASLTIPVFPAL